MRDQPFDSDYEHKIYQDEQYRFVQSLPERIQNHLSIRLHYASKSLYWSENNRWHDFNPQLSVDEGGTPISKKIAESRLVVHSYDSTGILENLSMNIPTICFWYNGLNHVIPEAKPYYERLHKAGILAYTPEEAAEMVTLRWDNVDAWWKSDDVQDARKLFCDQYARIEKKPVKVLKKILEKYS
jgi:putative transferase (TIGR04331 family)